MGRAIEMGVREQLIALKQAGYSLLAISQQLGLRYGTVCRLSAHFNRKGNLAVSYGNCGPKQPTSSPLVWRAALWLKRLHPGWGAPFIRLHLLERYKQLRIPASRTMQEWFGKAALNKPRPQLHQPHVGTSKAVHNIWQVDAKERLTLLDGSAACYLTITDEHSGAGLAALVFPPPLYLTSAGRGSQKKAGANL